MYLADAKRRVEKKHSSSCWTSLMSRGLACCRSAHERSLSSSRLKTVPFGRSTKARQKKQTCKKKTCLMIMFFLIYPLSQQRMLRTEQQSVIASWRSKMDVCALSCSIAFPRMDLQTSSRPNASVKMLWVCLTSCLMQRNEPNPPWT